MNATRTQTILFDVLVPRATRAQNALLVVTGSLFMALCAQIALPLPFSPVPVTGQTFGVLLLGATLGARRAALALLLYLAEGAAGLPVFAPVGAPGLARLAGPTAGYLLACPVAAFVLGRLLEVSARRSLRRWLAATLAAEAIMFAAGTAWLKVLIIADWQQALLLGVVPFLPGETVKIALVGVCLPASWWALAARRRS